MKKRPSLSAVFGRACPHCLITVDPVCYGWHVGKCSSKNLASNSKQDMAPRTPVKIEAAGNSHFREAAIPFLSPAQASTLASESQISAMPASGDTVVQSLIFGNEDLENLWRENQTLKEDLKLKSEENEALKHKLRNLDLRWEETTDKMKILELKIEDLELQVRLVKEDENNVPCLLNRNKNAQCDEKGMHSQPSETSDVKALGLVNGSSTDSGIRNSQRQVDVVDSVKENNVAMNFASSDDMEKKLDLDRIVHLACGECAMSQEFVSQVEGVIKAKEAVSSTVNTSRKQRILSGLLCNASDADEKQEVSGKGYNLCSANFDVTNFQNGFSSEVECLASHALMPFQTLANEEVLCTPSALRSSMGKQSSREDSVNIGVAEVNGETDVGMHERVLPETQHHAADTSLHVENPSTVRFPYVPVEGDSDSNAKQQMMEAQSHSTSASIEREINAAKAKTGFRRMVLQSDSESDGDTIQGIHSGKKTHETESCDSKKRASPHLSFNAGDKQSERFCEDFWAKSKCTPCKSSQPNLQRSKRLNLVCILDQSDDAICKGEAKNSNHGSPNAAVIDLEGASEDGFPDEKHAGVRRSKRLREMSIQKPRDSVQKENMGVEKSSSSDDETVAIIEEWEESESGMSGRFHSEAPKAQLKRKRPSKTQKRLFEDFESRPLNGKRYGLDSEDDDSENESDDDSLKGFITESEGLGSTGDSSEYQSSSSSYSSMEFFRDPKHTRDIKKKNYVWELEGEMLAMFAVDPELCLRAVCALNRRQTEDEQKEKASKYANKRGFDTLRAARGSRLAEYLTDGDIYGPVKKSPEELKRFDAGGLEFCKMLAFHHSKQLFEMYTNEEDPYFPFA